MIRTQIQLTEIQSQALKQLAAQRGQSIAELIRQSIDLFLQRAQKSEIEKEEKWRRALAAVGKFHADVSDLSVNHDEYFAQAIEDYPRRKIATDKVATNP